MKNRIGGIDMKFQFDHLVQFVDEPKTAIKILEDNGIHAVEGGVHTNRGTFNTLSYFDLSYIEYLGTYDRKLVEQTKHLPHSLIETVVNDQFAKALSALQSERLILKELHAVSRKKA